MYILPQIETDYQYIITEYNKLTYINTNYTGLPQKTNKLQHITTEYIGLTQIIKNYNRLKLNIIQYHILP